MGVREDWRAIVETYRDSHQSRAAAVAEARRELVLADHAAGMTFEQIGEKLGVSKSRAAELHADALARRQRTPPVIAWDSVTGDTPIKALPLPGEFRGEIGRCGFERVGDMLALDRETLIKKLSRGRSIGPKRKREILTLLEFIQPTGMLVAEFRAESSLGWLGDWRPTYEDAVEDAVRAGEAIRGADGKLFLSQACSIRER